MASYDGIEGIYGVGERDEPPLCACGAGYVGHAPEYNGWTNRSTWAVALWVGNDEPLYRAAQWLARSTTVDALTARAWLISQSGYGAQMARREAQPLAHVDWDAIAEMIRETVEP